MPDEIMVGDWVKWNYRMPFDEIGEVMSVETPSIGPAYYVVSGKPVMHHDILEIRKKDITHAR